MKRIAHITIALLFIQCTQNNHTEIKENSGELMVKEKDQTGIESEENSKLLMTFSGSVEPYQEIKLYGCDFAVVLNESNDTTHWSTNDNKFETPEGFKVGTNWEELPTELQNAVNQMPGWGYYIKLNSGWQLGFCEGESCTDSEPKDGSTVKWIFKRSD